MVKNMSNDLNMQMEQRVSEKGKKEQDTPKRCVVRRY